MIETVSTVNTMIVWENEKGRFEWELNSRHFGKMDGLVVHKWKHIDTEGLR